MKTKLSKIALLAAIVAIGASCSPRTPIADPIPVEATVTTPDAAQGAATTVATSSADTAQPADTTVPATAADSLAPTATSPMPLPTELLGLPQIEQAKADLAGRLSVPLADIAVVTAQSVTWPNAALGCPQPGMAYAEVLVEGLFVQLAYGGQTYNYHGGGAEPLFLCELAGAVTKGTPLFGDVTLPPPTPGN